MAEKVHPLRVRRVRAGTAAGMGGYRRRVGAGTAAGRGGYRGPY